MDKYSLLKELTVLDFMALDLQLYLNTHPNDYEAICKYNSVIVGADTVRVEYEKHFGPLCSFRSLGRRDWPWMDEPWPWAKDGNFEMC